MGSSAELAAWKSDSSVRASVITGWKTGVPADGWCTLQLFAGEVRVRESWFNANPPAVGGYYVEYTPEEAVYMPARLFDRVYKRDRDHAVPKGVVANTAATGSFDDALLDVINRFNRPGSPVDSRVLCKFLISCAEAFVHGYKAQQAVR